MSFESWLEAARIDAAKLNQELLAVLRAAFRFLEHGGCDYASRRLVEHFLLNSGLSLKVAQVARLVGMDRCTSSRHQRCSSQEVVEAINNRLAGKYPGKLLPRYAGPIAQFLLDHPHATRDDLLDFIEATFGVRAHYRALQRFLEKYGLDRKSLQPSQEDRPSAERVVVETSNRPSGALIPQPSQDFFFATRSMPERF
jgi:hypothetical protein